MLQFLFLALMSSVSFAREDSCLRLLTSDASPGEESLFPDSVEINQAQLWLMDHGRGAAAEAEGAEIFAEWERWNKVTKAQRNANLALELKRISPANDSNFVSLNGRAQLELLSRQNLKRMLIQLEQRYIQIAVLLNDKTLEKQSRAVSDLLRIAYSVDRPMRNDDGVNAPIVSPRQLQKHHLVSKNHSAYSWLTGGSPSAEFEIRFGAPKAMLPSAIYLRHDFARDEGFVLPQLEINETLFNFFAEWEPEALEQVYAHNRLSFPNKVNSGLKMLEYFKQGPVTIEDVFPAHAPQKLSELRERLSKYVLTEPHAKEFIRHSLQLYVLWLKHTNIAEYDKLISGLYGEAGPGDFVFSKFLRFAGLPGLSLRIPVVSNAKDYTLVRDIPQAELFRYGMPFGTVDYLKRGTGRGRLDHTSQP